MPIHIVVGNADIVLEKFTSIIRNLERPRPALEEVRQDFFRVEEEWFATAGRGTWAPLSPSTLRSKPAGTGILVRSGALRASLTRAGARYGYNRINRATLFVGTQHPAAEFHEAGTRFMPRRELIGVGDRDIERWTGIIADRVVEEQEAGVVGKTVRRVQQWLGL